MDIPDQAVITVLTYLLPGFITSELLHVLTPAPRPIPFERVVRALIFTMLVQLGVSVVDFALRRFGSAGLTAGNWIEPSRLGLSVVVAVVLGVLFAWIANADRLHGALRLLRVTRQTSYSSEWYGAFSKNVGYIVLHLEGKRRLLGWPVEWPSTPGKGHFVMANAEWLSDEIGGRSIELAEVNQILVKAEDVEMIELMKVSDRPREGTDGRAKATDTTAPAAGQTT